MEYLTVRETSEKWGMSIRMVNYYLNTGRIEGAVRKKSEWLIPYTAKSPLDTRKKADTKKSTKRKRNVNKCYMPLIASPCPGSFHEFEHSLADEEERQITRALWHYFRNEEKECCTVSEQCFNSESVQIRLAARLVHAMATVQEGDPAAVLADFNAIALENKKTSDPSAKLYTLVTEGFVSVFFHSESADLSVLRDKISLCQAGIQYYVIYAAAHELYLRREYQRAMGMAGNNFPIASIYLNLVLCMICMNLKDDEHADAAFMRAWNIALPEHYIHPFIEHHGLLQGQIERSLREQYPDAEIGVLHEWEGIKYLVDTLALSHRGQAPSYDDYPEALCEMAETYIKDKKPALVAVCFDQLDHVGHKSGHDTQEYYNCLHTLDGYIGRIIQAIKDAGIWDDTIIMLTADHGGINKGHGGITLEEVEIPFIIAGKNIKQSGEFQESMMQFDTAATIAYVFRLEQPQVWTGRPMKQVFKK